MAPELVKRSEALGKMVMQLRGTLSEARIESVMKAAQEEWHKAMPPECRAVWSKARSKELATPRVGEAQPFKTESRKPKPPEVNSKEKPTMKDEEDPRRKLELSRAM